MAHHKGLITSAIGWFGACAAVVALVEWLLWRRMGYPEPAAGLLAALGFVIVTLAASIGFFRRWRKHAAGELARYFENSPVGLCLLDAEGRIAQCNSAFAGFLGYSERELQGMRYADLIHPEGTNAIAQQNFGSEPPASPYLACGGGGSGNEDRALRLRSYRKKNGDICWGKQGFSPLAAAGASAGTLVTVQDVTPEQQALQTLQASEQKLKKLLAEAQHSEKLVLMLARAVESATDSIVITDLNGSIEYVNPHFEILTGYTRKEIYGRNPRVLKSGRQSPEFYAELWRTLKSGGVWKGRFVNRRKDGSLYTEEATIAPVHDALGVPQKYVAVKRDVTRLEELESQLRQAQKMEAVGQLAGGIAHDLNNVLQVVTLASHLALTGKDPQFKDARIKETIAAAQKGAGVIRQLLAFGRRQLLRLEVLNLNDVVREAAKLMQHLLRENIKLSIDLDPTLDNIKADPVQLTQVILNLALNSRDAMPEGGLLEISTENCEMTGKPEGRTYIPPGRYVRLIVRDTGTGIDEASQEHIFEPFFTTKENGKGTGLGLSTVYGIVAQSGGFIDFDSVVGGGTAFFVCFPRTQEPIARPSQAEEVEQSALPVAASCSVLVVEDEEMVRNSIAAALKREGFSVHAFESSQAAWEAAAGIKPNLVISDIVLDGMKGTELVAQLKKRSPEIQSILISGYGEEERALPATALPGVIFMSKPFTMAELVKSAVSLCKARP